ncbi:protein-ADP-ribose hydrolase [Arcanobacterium haemolyticum]|nr:protein-ADP-ribose hydrolase [Arcanobacterium haemolyticum]
MMNVRPPWRARPEFLTAQDELLSTLISEKGISTVADAIPCQEDARMLLWRGDITTLATDAIVNAANSGMTGCWHPLHSCIDNAIHTFAGVQLRAEMASLMEEQGHEEPTAHARLTSAYNLPAQYVIHTVGPIANGKPTDEHRQQLANCYTACLDTAAAHDCLSIALCCVSTGVFGFPQREAAEIATRTVRQWLVDHPQSPMRVVFNVYGETDEAIYRDVLEFE